MYKVEGKSLKGYAKKSPRQDKTPFIQNTKIINSDIDESMGQLGTVKQGVNHKISNIEDSQGQIGTVKQGAT